MNKNKYYIVRQKHNDTYTYCGLFKYDEYFVGSEEAYIKKLGAAALKNSGIVLYEPTADSYVLMSFNQGNCLIDVFAEGKYMEKTELKKALLDSMQNNAGINDTQLSPMVVGHNL